MPLAMITEIIARTYHKDGVVMFEDEVGDMSCVKSAEEPPELRAVMSHQERMEVQNVIAEWFKAQPRTLAEFEAGAIKAKARLSEIESRTGASLAMTIHIVESLGLNARNGRHFGLRTAGRSCKMSRTTVRFHMRLLRSALKLDFDSQPLHAAGVGIVQNDIPPIPFE